MLLLVIAGLAVLGLSTGVQNSDGRAVSIVAGILLLCLAAARAFGGWWRER